MKIADIISFLRDNDVDFNFFGNADEEIRGYSSLYRYKAGTFVWARDLATFLGRDTPEKELFTLLITSYDNLETENILAKIMTKNPRSVFFLLVDHFWKETKECGIASSAIVKTGAELGKNVTIGDGCIISGKTKIGDGTTLGCHVVTIGKVIIGSNCHIQSGVVIGEDGMALVKDNFFYQPIPHYGGVTIGDRVYIGANSCICRGTIEDTVLGDDVKMDQLCQVAHNTVVGDGTVMMAGTLLHGGVVIGEGSKLNSAIVKEQKVLGKNVVVGHGVAVTKRLPDNVIAQGNPISVVNREKSCL